MKRKEFIIVFLVCLFLVGLFFHKTIFSGLIPFPGDLLIAEYNPWKQYSIEGYVPGSYPNKAQYFDAIRQMYPWRAFATESLSHFSFPLWNPYNFAGSPLFANSQSAVLYPLSLFYLFFPQDVGWTILVVLQIALCFSFTYLYCRKIGITLLGSLLSAVSFSCCLFVAVFLEYNTIVQVILWMPLALYFIERVLKSHAFLNLFGLVASVSIPFFAGHLQVAFFAYFAICFYFLYRIATDNEIKKKMVQLLLLSPFLVLPLGLSGVQLIPTFELQAFSARVSHQAEFLLRALIFQPHELIMYFSPDVFGNPAFRNFGLDTSYATRASYVGIIPLFFAFLAVWHSFKNLYVRFFVILFVLFFLLTVRTPFSEILYGLHIPFLSSSSPSNLLFLLSFSVSILAGFGVDAFLSLKKRFLLKEIGIFLGIFILFVILAKTSLITTFDKNLLYSFGLLGICFVLVIVGDFLKKYKQLVICFLILITALDLFYFFSKYNPFVPRELIFPNTKVTDFLVKNSGTSRSWGYGSGNIDANIQSFFGFPSPNGYDPLYPKSYGEFIYSSFEGKLLKEFSNATRTDANISREGAIDKNSSRLRVLDLLGVKYITIKPKEDAELSKSSRFELVFDSPEWRVYRNTLSLPRFFLASDYKIAKTQSQFNSIFFDKSFNPRETVILEKKPVNFSPSSGSEPGEVSLSSYGSNKVELKTKAEDNTLLFLSDTYFPGWIASVDGKETQIYKANHAFRAVVLPSGVHDIVFEYKPQSFFFGIIVSIISGVFFLGYGVVVGKKTK